jgi:hypothetical protein
MYKLVLPFLLIDLGRREIGNLILLYFTFMAVK